MPNYCENRLSVSGSVAAIKSFIALYFNKEGLDFNKVVPEPRRMKDCPEEYIIPRDKRSKSSVSQKEDRPWFDWYNFHLNKWGTKWSAVHYGTFEIPDDLMRADPTSHYELDLYFDTAWSTCRPIVQALIEKCSSLKFTLYYYECGMDFAGYYDETGDNPADDTKQFAIDYMGYDEESFEDEEDV